MREQGSSHFRSVALAREYHHQFFHDDGSVTDPLTFAVDSLLLWLNGWESIDSAAKAFPSGPRRERHIAMERSLGASHLAPNDCSPRSRARIRTLFHDVLQSASDMAFHSKEEGDSYVLFSDLNVRMRRYATFPSLVYFRGTGAIYQESPKAPRHATPGRKWVKPHTPHGEVLAAHGIMDLAADGTLDRIRQCECGTWFYAKRSHGISCKPDCRYKRHQQTPEYKARRREAARKQAEARRKGFGAT